MPDPLLNYTLASVAALLRQSRQVEGMLDAASRERAEELEGYLLLGGPSGLPAPPLPWVGMSVVVTEMAPRYIARKLSRWERWRVRLERVLGRWWRWERVEQRTEAIWRKGDVLHVHPEVMGRLREEYNR